MTIKDDYRDALEGFKLPRYREIPDVGLYLEQCSKYISDCLQPIGDLGLTGSMISNYVKKKLIANPVKKQYCRQQIAYLMFIAIAKSVLSMENIRSLFALQKDSYEPEIAYDYFCDEFERALKMVFGGAEDMSVIAEKNFQLKMLLRRTIITAAYKIYLDKCFEGISAS